MRVMSGSPTSGLPVAIDITDPDLSRAAARMVESALGWVVVEDSPELPARLWLTDLDAVRPGAVVLLADGGPDEVARALRAGAVEVLSWPPDPDRLARSVPRRSPPSPALLVTVGGAAGGVGTTTVATTLAAAFAWQGRPTHLVSDHAADVVTLDASRCATQLPTLRVVTHLRDVPPAALEAHPVVVDLGVGGPCHVLVARPDQALVRALRTLTPAVVVVVDRGALEEAEVQRLTDVPTLHLPWSRRVARGALRAALPGVLPGRLVADVAGLVRHLPGGRNDPPCRPVALRAVAA